MDDFLNVCSGSPSLASQQLAIILAAFDYLGVPLATDKIEGPCHILVFLGIILDCLAMEARLPDAKLNELRMLLAEYRSRRTLTQRELDSLLGKLSFAARVVVPGRTFMRRLWDLNTKFAQAKPFFTITLSDECRKDLNWWDHLLTNWNGRSFFLHSVWTPAEDLGLYTDASGSLGWGAYYGAEQRWMSEKWTAEQQDMSIDFKELFAIVAACAAWGQGWTSMRIRLHCDNLPVVQCVTSGSSRAPTLMPLLRCLMMICARQNFVLSAVHVAGVKNVVADALSRCNLQEFRRLAPRARLEPDEVPTFPWLD